MISVWRPLDEPGAFTNLFRRWRSALGIVTSEQNSDLAIDVIGSSSVHIELPSSCVLLLNLAEHL